MPAHWPAFIATPNGQHVWPIATIMTVVPVWLSRVEEHQHVVIMYKSRTLAAIIYLAADLLASLNIDALVLTVILVLFTLEFRARACTSAFEQQMDYKLTRTETCECARLDQRSSVAPRRQNYQQLLAWCVCIATNTVQCSPIKHISVMCAFNEG